jgi:hypothetical protein
MTSTVNNGVVALSTEARPLEIMVCAATNSEKGITLLSMPMPKNGSQPARPFGRAPPDAFRNGNSRTAPNATRTNTMVSGGKSRSATPVKKNEPPHSTESSTSSCALWRSIVSAGLPISYLCCAPAAAIHPVPAWPVDWCRASDRNAKAATAAHGVAAPEARSRGLRFPTDDTA